MMERYGVDNIRKSKEFHEYMIVMGLRYSEGELPIHREYRNKVMGVTRRNVDKFQNILFNGKVDDNEVYHIDHIYSIHEGYINKIDPEIIGDIANLQLLPADINRKKSTDCWITKEELLERYQKGVTITLQQDII